MKPFTVVLRRSDRLCGAMEFDPIARSHDSYTAHVQAEDAGAAQDVAIRQVRKADRKDLKHLAEQTGTHYLATSKDYYVLAVFGGTQQVQLFGWETYAQLTRKLP